MVSFRSSDGRDDGPLEEVETGGLRRLQGTGRLVIVVGDQTSYHIQSRKCFCFAIDV